jgi:hypothetical protein
MCHEPFMEGQLIHVDHDHACCQGKNRSRGKCIRGLLRVIGNSWTLLIPRCFCWRSCWECRVPVYLLVCRRGYIFTCRIGLPAFELRHIYGQVPRSADSSLISIGLLVGNRGPFQEGPAEPVRQGTWKSAVSAVIVAQSVTQLPASAAAPRGRYSWRVRIGLSCVPPSQATSQRSAQTPAALFENRAQQMLAERDQIDDFVFVSGDDMRRLDELKAQLRDTTREPTKRLAAYRRWQL